MPDQVPYALRDGGKHFLEVTIGDQQTVDFHQRLQPFFLFLQRLPHQRIFHRQSYEFRHPRQQLQIAFSIRRGFRGAKAQCAQLLLSCAQRQHAVRADSSSPWHVRHCWKPRLHTQIGKYQRLLILPYPAAHRVLDRHFHGDSGLLTAFPYVQAHEPLRCIVKRYIDKLKVGDSL